MSNEEKMREDFERKHESFLREDKQWIMYGYDEGVKACAAIKDAEIAARDLMIKELREALEGIRLELGYEWLHDIFNSARAALAKSEHHNSRALEKMLLEARMEGFILADEVADTSYEFTLEVMKAKLAELNKE